MFPTLIHPFPQLQGNNYQCRKYLPWIDFREHLLETPINIMVKKKHMDSGEEFPVKKQSVEFKFRTIRLGTFDDNWGYV